MSSEVHQLDGRWWVVYVHLDEEDAGRFRSGRALTGVSGGVDRRAMDLPWIVRPPEPRGGKCHVLLPTGLLFRLDRLTRGMRVGSNLSATAPSVGRHVAHVYAVLRDRYPLDVMEMLFAAGSDAIYAAYDEARGVRA